MSSIKASDTVEITDEECNSTNCASARKWSSDCFYMFTLNRAQSTAFLKANHGIFMDCFEPTHRGEKNQLPSAGPGDGSDENPAPRPIKFREFL